MKTSGEIGRKSKSDFPNTLDVLKQVSDVISNRNHQIFAKDISWHVGSTWIEVSGPWHISWHIDIQVKVFKDRGSI